MSDKVVLLYDIANFVWQLVPLFSKRHEVVLLLQRSCSITPNDQNMLGNLEHKYLYIVFMCFLNA